MFVFTPENDMSGLVKDIKEKKEGVFNFITSGDFVFIVDEEIPELPPGSEKNNELKMHCININSIERLAKFDKSITLILKESNNRAIFIYYRSENNCLNSFIELSSLLLKQRDKVSISDIKKELETKNSFFLNKL